MKKLRFLVFVLAAAATTAVRWMQLMSIDAQGLPAYGMSALCFVPLAVAAVFVLLSLREKGSDAPMDELFDFSGTLPLFFGVAGAFALIAAAVLLVLGGFAMASAILAAFLAVSGGCVFYVLVCLKKGLEFPGIAIGFPAAYLSVQLVFTYRECAKDPVLINFYMELLAVAALAWAFMQLCAFAFRGGAPKAYLSVAFTAAVVSVAGAVTAATLFWLVMLSGFALVQLAFLAAYKG